MLSELKVWLTPYELLIAIPFHREVLYPMTMSRLEPVKVTLG